MAPRTYAIPAALIGITTTTGCTPPIVGDWSMTSLTYAGYPGLDMVEGYTYGAYTVSLQGDMSVDKDLTGTFNFKSNITYNGQRYVYPYSYGLTAAETAKSEYQIKFDAASGIPVWDCTVDSALMTCDDGGGGTREFEQ